MGNEQKEKGHWFNVVIFFLIVKAIFSFYSIITYFGDPNVARFLTESSQIAKIYYYGFGPILFALTPLVLAMFLYKRIFYRTCKILAVFVCLGVPIGTALGIFTLILLRREPIKFEFDYSKTQETNETANKSLNTDG